MNKTFSHGSIENMKAAFENKISQLEGGNTDVESTTNVEANTDPVSRLERYIEIDLPEQFDYIETHYNNGELDLSRAKRLADGCQKLYNLFDEVIYEIEHSDIESNTKIEGDEYVGVESGEASSSYIEDLINDCNNELESEEFFDGITWEETEQALELTCVEGNRVLNYTIPKADLNMDNLESDRDYICNTVRADINRDYYEDVDSIDAEDDYEF